MPVPGWGVRLVDPETGGDVAAGGEGEVWVCGPNVMAGYHNLPEATAGAMVDGWLRTGDIGHLDAQGYLFLFDRAKDVIVSGGENIYPAEVENAIFGHPDVAEVAIIGVPSQRWGEEVMAVIVPRAGASPELASIAGWVKTRIASFKVPKQLSIVTELPRNAGNKVLRRVLREPYWKDLQRRIN